MSHPAWVRGLKQVQVLSDDQWQMSHPAWVRGLKQEVISNAASQDEVAPRVGAWIETILTVRSFQAKMSHPAWVRGLKPLLHN